MTLTLINNLNLKEGESIRLYYGEGETGWAKYLGNDKFSIENIPLEDGINIDDIVTIKDTEEKDDSINSPHLPSINEIVEQKIFNKVAVRYESTSQFYELRDKIKEEGGKIEGVVEPLDSETGLCLVAYNDPLDLDQIIKDIGITTPQDFE